jgi:hypothetical protein
MDRLFHNRILEAAILASLLAQVIKTLLTLWIDRRWNWTRLYETGGMPSAHAAGVTALAVSIGLRAGWGSSLFAIAAVFGYVVIYDALNVRRATGQHAERINEIMGRIQHPLDRDDQSQSLKTLLGHTYPQVLVGSLLGAATGLLVCR